MYVISILRPDQKHTHEKYYTFLLIFALLTSLVKRLAVGVVFDTSEVPSTFCASTHECRGLRVVVLSPV